MKKSRLLLYILAISFPLFSVEYLRLNIGIMHTPMPLFILSIIFLTGFIHLTFNNKVNLGFLREKRILILILIFFIIIHSFSMLFSDSEYPIQLQFKEIIKLVIGVSSFCIFYDIIIKNSRYMNLFFVILLWSSTIFYAYFCFKSISNGNPFLSANLLESSSTKLKNQFAWYAATMFPFSLSYLMIGKINFSKILPFIVFSISIIYLASRGAWIAAFISFPVIIYYLSKISFKKTFFLSAKIVFCASAVLIAIIYYLSNYVNLDLILMRFSWIINPIETEVLSGGQLNTLHERTGRLTRGLNTFYENPFFGKGVYNYACHNDYLTILAETGFSGFLSFVIINIYVFLKINKIDMDNFNFYTLGSKGAFASIFISSMVIDTYRSPHYWFFLAIILAVSGLEKRKQLKFS